MQIEVNFLGMKLCEQIKQAGKGTA